MPLDVKITELPAAFSVNASDLFVIVDLSGLPTTKSVTAAGLASLSPVQSVAGKTGAVTLTVDDVDQLQAALDSKQSAGSYVQLLWDNRTIDGTVNNYVVGSANMLVVTPTNSARITGAAGGTASAWFRLINASANPLTIEHQSTSSLPENRFIIASGVDYTLGENEEAGFFYDPVSNRWRISTCCVTPY
jgi:hypothetical protein